MRQGNSLNINREVKMNMKKGNYEEPNISVCIFEHEDIVTLSNIGTSTGDIIPFSSLRTTDLEEEGF